MLFVNFHMHCSPSLKNVHVYIIFSYYNCAGVHMILKIFFRIRISPTFSTTNCAEMLNVNFVAHDNSWNVADLLDLQGAGVDLSEGEECVTLCDIIH